MTQTSSAPACPRCAAALKDANARFCSACGAAVGSAGCSGCGTAPTPGARFCHRCGTAAGAAAPPASIPTARGDAFSNALPWAVAGIALVALIALIAGQRFSGRATDAVPVAQASPSLGASGMRASDISALSPRERADRLFDRIMLLDEQGKADSVQFFAQMGISAFQMLPELDAHARYDVGRIAEVAGIASIAQAQADTILSADSNHLLGLILAGNAARLSGNSAAAREYDQRLVSAAPAERARGLLEYQQHQADIDTALARFARGN
jgi:hypothetical protein